ncbi:BrnT family toxin [Pseudomonas lopnurensis]|uniref:BrnT family toxin n=1 Tax=Pseudomonas lopnurensis TaxID=1477517 RepID=UPI0034D976EB
MPRRRPAQTWGQLRRSRGVFRDPRALSLFDENHSQSEERWITLGQTGGRKLVVVVRTWREDDSNHIHVRLISARLATSHETQQYEG